jgi:type IV pilus assembly protein PilE
MYGAKFHQVRGFTLLEMVVAMAIIGILAILTLPSYQEAVRTGRRGDAKAELMRLAQRQAHWRMTHKAYATLLELGGAANNKDYQFNIKANTATAFEIMATPTNSHGQDQDICGTLSIDQDAILTSNQNACPKP